MAKKRREAPASEGGPKEKRKPAWKTGLDYIVMLAGALLIALVIKAYVFDVYLIPSGSMETTLHGRPDGGDRIFCSKLNYYFRTPERWEVAVFEFPYESARRSDAFNISEQYKGQNFVKRVVGLPDEALAIAKGDIWVRPANAKAEYQRMVKPDSVQRGVWLNVYEEDFADLARPELDQFWRIAGGDNITLEKGGPLLLRPGTDGVRLDFRPKTPAGPAREAMLDLPGIPDRYTLRQPVQFKCRAQNAEGETCGHVFVKTIQTHNMQARCPTCGVLQDETAAIFYHRRSGLPEVGRFAVNPRFAPQGEDVGARQSDYHYVPDLRVVTDLTLAKESSRYAVVLSEDSRQVQAVFSGDGRIDLQVNGRPSTPQQRATAEIKPGRNHRVEFYVVDGVARIFVDSEKEPALEVTVWEDKRPLPRSLVKSSGVALVAAGGDVTIRKLLIDRDIFYYSGWEHDRGERFAQMNSQGEVYINSESFFPMGDHCPSSFDARSWGPVSLSLLRGPALFVWWPPDRAGKIAAP